MNSPRHSTDAARPKRRPRPQRSSASGRGAATDGHQPRPARPAGQQAPRRSEATSPAPPARPIPDVADDNGFVAIGVPTRIAGALLSVGVEAPFPIQTATLPDSLAGRDLLGRGKTGSGKTLAFSIPLVAALARSGRRTRRGFPRGLVLVPTRELARQVADVIEPLASAERMSVATIFGGVGQNPQVNALRNGADIVVACPGRLEDLVGQGHCRLDEVEVTVLDEADMMSDFGFLPSVRRLLDATPSGGQRLLFSATLDNAVKSVVDRYLTDPVVHSVDPAVAPVPTMVHHVFEITAADKAPVVYALASGADRVLFFTRTKHVAKKWTKALVANGIPAVELHGNLSQNARVHNLEQFASGQIRVLVATDIAARGIHVDDVALVVHVDPPAEHKAYLHRSGRTARAGSDGTVVTLMLPEQRKDVNALARAAGIRPTFTAVSPGHSLIGELVGEPVPRTRPTNADVALPPAERPAANRQPRPPRRPRAKVGASAGATAGAPSARRSRQPVGAPSGSNSARTQRDTAGTPARRRRSNPR